MDQTYLRRQPLSYRLVALFILGISFFIASRAFSLQTPVTEAQRLNSRYGQFADRNGHALVDGATLSGQVFIQYLPTRLYYVQSIRKIEFRIDGELLNIETLFPYYLGSDRNGVPNGYDLNRQGAGTHTLSVRILTKRGHLITDQLTYVNGIASSTAIPSATVPNIPATKTSVPEPSSTMPPHATATEDAEPSATRAARATATTVPVIVATATDMPMPTTMPSSMPPMDGGDVDAPNGAAMSYNVWRPTKYDTCPNAADTARIVEIHNSYSVIGPDGKRYPTWHPAIDPATGCHFGHEHGSDPRTSSLWPLIQQHFAYNGDTSQSGLPFGYADEYSMSPTMRHEDHVGFKVEVQNHAQMFAGVTGTGNKQYLNIYCDFMAEVHMGTHSPDAFINNNHETVNFTKCTNGIEYRVTKLSAFGDYGKFNSINTCDAPPVVVPGAVNPGFPEGFVRFIGSRECINKTILVTTGFSQLLYEIWSSSNALTKAGGSSILNFTVEMAVFDPSRFYDPAKPNNLARSVDVCYETGPNGGRVKGAAFPCDSVKDLNPPVAFDDPRSPFKGEEREVYFSAGTVKNSGGATTWYTDVFGRNGQTTPFANSIKQYVAAVNVDINATLPQGVYLQPNALGKEHRYGCINYEANGGSCINAGIHSPN